MRDRENKALLALALQRVPFLRPKEKRILADSLECLEELASLTHSGLEKRIGRFLRTKNWRPGGLEEAAKSDALILERIGASFIHCEDGRFPAALAEIPDAPFGIYVRGGAMPTDRPSVAVVGTRMPTGLGLAEAQRFSRDLAIEGLPVISGLALGIDAAAHRGALDGARRRVASGNRSVDAASSDRGVPTCAVLACGVEAVYPASNRSLAAAILESGGLLISEYPPGTEIARFRFPERNRIIAGLSRAVVIVEAPENSGALITAEFALEQGRDVCVCAARLGGPRSAGIERLAQEGARELGSARELLVEWGFAPSAQAPVEPGLLFSEVDNTAFLESTGESLPEGRRLAAALRGELSLVGELGVARERSLPFGVSRRRRTVGHSSNPVSSARLRPRRAPGGGSRNG